MEELSHIKQILRDCLSLGPRADTLTADSGLLGEIPEFDSMAVLTVVTAIEEQLGVRFDDDELSAEVFATVGSLATFVAAKTGGRQVA